MGITITLTEAERRTFMALIDQQLAILQAQIDTGRRLSDLKTRLEKAAESVPTDPNSVPRDLP